jgi:hypothetical protein
MIFVRQGIALAFSTALAFAAVGRAESQRFVYEKAEMGVPFRITLYAIRRNRRRQRPTPLLPGSKS